MSILQVSGIGLREHGNVVLQGITFTQHAFQKIAITGETGSGKSTLLQVIAGLVQPDEGKVIFNDRRVRGPQERLVPGNPGIAYLTQHSDLPPYLRVEQVLKYASKINPEEAGLLFELCRIDHLLKRKTHQVSGGERQRIALARLLLTSPRLLLLDEPYSSLDMVHKNILKNVIRDIGEELDITLMLISHDPLDTLSWADEILVMRSGKVIQQGIPKHIYQQPVNEYTASLFGIYNLIPVAQANALAIFPGDKQNKKSLLIRPESFKLTEYKNQAIPGKVNKLVYFGSYYEAEVQLSEISIIARTSDHTLKPGDTVYVSLYEKGVWYL